MTAAVTGPFGDVLDRDVLDRDVLGIMYNPHYVEMLRVGGPV